VQLRLPPRYGDEFRGMLVRPSSKTPPTWGGVPLARRRILLGIAAVGGFLAVDIGAVAYAGGWIGTAHRLTPHIFIKHSNGSTESNRAFARTTRKALP